MHSSSFKGISFGIVSGVITTLGMMVGLDSGTQSKFIVILGVLTIAVSDALSDALGVHVSEESDKESVKNIWRSTISTFLSKFVFASSFIIPLIFFDLRTAIPLSIFYGLVLIASISYIIAKRQKKSAKHAVIEHLLIAVIVIIITYFVGKYFSYLSLI
ncbi:MAG: hypothetical protein JW791_04600 [Nanoarchaeota archaeon]|nr:hypothetical protein [Nanoarchaeota archaeon]